MAFDDNTPEGTVDDEYRDEEAAAASLDDAAIEEAEDSDEEHPEASGESAVENQGEAEASDEPADDEPEPATEDVPVAPVAQSKIRLSDGTEITPDEVEKGYQRQADYTRKTQEIASDRTQLAAFATHAQQTLDLAIRMIGDTLPAAPDEALIHSDPIQFLAQKQAFENGQRKLAAAIEARKANEGEIAKTRQREQAVTDADARKIVSNELKLLGDKIPKLATDAGRQAFLTEAVEHGKHYGLTSELIAGTTDHKLIAVLHDAIQFRKLQAAKPAAAAKLKTLPPIRSAARQAPGAQQGQRNVKAWDRLKREGSIEAAADALPDSLFN